MLHLLSSIGLAYLTGSGLATNAAVVGRGLAHAVGTAAKGEYREATIEVLGSLAAPALLCYGSITGLCRDVVAVAEELAAPILEKATQK